MSAPTEIATDAAPGRPAGPRTSLRVLQVAAVVHTVVMVVQPVFAGWYLDGAGEGLSWHRNNANVVALFDLVQLVCAIVYTWRGRGARWPIWASLVILLLVEVQIGFGYTRLLAVHVPLGVSVIAIQLIVTALLFRPALAQARPRKAAKAAQP